MAFKKQNRQVRRRLRRPSRPDFAAVAFLTILSAVRALAQDTDTQPTPEPSNEVPIPQPLFETNQLESIAAPVNAGTPAPPLAGTSQLFSAPQQASLAGTTTPFRWGMLSLSPHLAYQLSYGNGLQASPGKQSNTLINQVTPGVLLGLGTHWSVDYAPSLRFYSSSLFKDGTDQFVILHGTTTYQDWTFGVSQSYSFSSQPLVETGAQTDQEAYSTVLTAGYQLNSEFSLSLGANQDFRFIGSSVPSELLTNVREWSTLDWLNYQIAVPLTVSLGGGFTYDNLSTGPDMTSEQLQGRVTWKPGTRLSLVFSGGLNDEQFVGAHIPNLLSPIFSGTAQYKLFETTSFALGASRAVVPSYFQNAVTESTAVTASLNQRLLEKFYLGVSGSYGSTSYHGTTTGPLGGNFGNYETTSVIVNLSTLLLRRVNASVFYQVAYNSSGAALYNYTTTQVGLTLGYHF